MAELPDTMMAVVTLGVGGYDKLVYQGVPTPRPGPGEVLVRVLAAGINNTEINTRLGWYSDSVTDGTDSTADDPADMAARGDGGWNATTPFPLIQGTDACGRVAACGEGADPWLIGKRVLIRACQRPKGFDDPENVWMGSDFDGAFAQYVVVRASEVFPVDCDWSDAELATLPCAYGTAENMLHRAGVVAGQRVLVTGASGGVGSAALQLARRRGAEVVAIAGAAKHAALADLGATRLLDRGEDPVAVLGRESVDVVVDNVGGAGFGQMLELLRRRGVYVSSGAIAGPVVSLDMRKMYLKDLRLIGTTGWDAQIFPNLVGYVERGEIRPLLDRTWPLERIAEAQQAFRQKTHVGKMVLIPPR
ncbi:MAG: zinc-binding dehydrogenase [Pseudomonadota bacterium]